jgi:hypothetical protein
VVLKSYIEPDAESVEATARAIGLCRTVLYQALNPNAAKRNGLPLLPSFKVGRRRLIRREARQAWLKQLEELQSANASSAA